MVNIADIRLPPSAVDIEKSVLSYILINNDIINICSLQPDDFYDIKHRQIFESIKNVKSNWVELIRQDLMKRSLESEYIYDIAVYDYNTNNYIDYENKLKDLSMKRKMINLSHWLIAKCYSDKENISEEIKKMIDVSLFTTTDSKLMSTVIMNMIDKMESGEWPVWVICKTWLQFLDDNIIWLSEWCFMIIAWAPSHGKSSLAFNIANYAIRNNQKVSVHSLEMTEEELWRVFCWFETWLSSNGQKTLKWANLTKFSEKVVPVFEFIDNLKVYRNNKLDKIENQIRRDTIAWIKIHVVDHMGLVNTWLPLSMKIIAQQAVTQKLKELAGELWIQIIWLSQLNKDWSKQGKSTWWDYDWNSLNWISDQDANIVIFVYQNDDERENIALATIPINVRIHKNRSWASKLSADLLFTKNTQIIKW